jgi:hypothetical protein
MNPILNIQIDVPETVHSKLEAAQKEIESAVGYNASMNELYVNALLRGVDEVADFMIDLVIIANARVQESSSLADHPNLSL